MSQLIPEEHRVFAQTIKKLLDSNPFLPERIEYEREALGDDYKEMKLPWNVKKWNSTSPLYWKR